MSIREILEESLFDQKDESTTIPLSFRVPSNLNNELEELTLTLDKSKTYLLLKFIEAGIVETNKILEEKSMNPKIEDQRDPNDFLNRKNFILNTNYNNDKYAQLEMLEKQEAAAFYDGWKEHILNLSEGDKVYLYQSGVGFVASGKVSGDLEKSEYKGTAEARYSKKLTDFKVGFKAISAKKFKQLTNGGANFRLTLAKLSLNQAHALDSEIERRMKLIED